MNYIHPTGNQYDPKGRSRLVVTFMVMFQDQQVVKLRAQVEGLSSKYIDSPGVYHADSCVVYLQPFTRDTYHKYTHEV